jgi:hypothetical protein
MMLTGPEGVCGCGGPVCRFAALVVQFIDVEKAHLAQHLVGTPYAVPPPVQEEVKRAKKEVKKGGGKRGKEGVLLPKGGVNQEVRRSAKCSFYVVLRCYFISFRSNAPA